MRRKLITGSLLLLGFQLSSSPAAAKCAGQVPTRQTIADASAVFVGTVVELENMKRWATVEVVDVWSGSVDAVVVVRAGPKDPPGPISAASDIDREYRLGQEYLFVPYHGEGARFRDNNCTSTTRYETRLDRLRPASAAYVSPTPDGTPARDVDETRGDGAGSNAWWIGAAALISGLGASMLFFRTRRPD